MDFRKLVLGVTLFVALFISEICMAGSPPPPPGGGGGGSDPPCWPPPCIPIDGGIGILVAAGIAYGGKKALDRQGKKAI
jgi:hypothetical protein